MQRAYKIAQWIMYISAMILIIFIVFNSKDANGKDSFGLWYVYSESMEPIIKTNDGFFVMRSKKYAIDDIITFKPKVLGQPYVTHRIVAITYDGKFITKGDNNPMSDQQGGEPLISKTQIIGKAVCINGKPMIIPKLGILSQKIQNNIPKVNVFIIVSIFVFGFLIEYVIAHILHKGKAIKNKKHLRLLDIAPYFDPLFFMIFLLVISNTFIIGQTIKSWKSDEISYVVVSTEGLPSPTPGEKFEKNKSLQNAAFIPFLIILEPEDNNISIISNKFVISPKQHAAYTLSIIAPEKTGYYTHSIHKKAYPNVLPGKLFNHLYSINPSLPLFIIFGPSMLWIMILYVLWIKRWDIDRKEIMDWLIPLRAILRKLA